MGFFDKFFGAKKKASVPSAAKQNDRIAVELRCAALGDGTCKIIGMNASTDFKIVIPEQMNGYKVVEIGGAAFANRTTIGVVKIPEGVTTISEDAFSDCDKLHTVDFPSTLEYIGASAFKNCGNLKSVCFGGTVAQWKKVRREDGWNIGSDNIQIACSDDSTFIDDMDWDLAKEKWDKEASSGFIWEQPPGYKIDNFCGIIGRGECGDYDIIIPTQIDGMTVRSVKGFYDDQEITSIRIPEGVRYLGSRAFAHSESLTTVELPTTIAEIAEESFYHCKGLTEFKIPQNVGCIYAKAFSGCTNLERIYMSSLCKAFRPGVFSDCSSLSEIIYDGTVEEWKAINKGDGWNSGIGVFTVKCNDGEVAYDEDGNENVVSDDN